jgi:hypothetical protein
MLTECGLPFLECVQGMETEELEVDIWGFIQKVWTNARKGKVLSEHKGIVSRGQWCLELTGMKRKKVENVLSPVASQ